MKLPAARLPGKPTLAGAFGGCAGLLVCYVAPLSPSARGTAWKAVLWVAVFAPLLPENHVAVALFDKTEMIHRGAPLECRGRPKRKLRSL